MEQKKLRYDNLYMNIARDVSEMSYAKRLHVGAVIVKDGNIIGYGWNGMPSGWENECENLIGYESGGNPVLKTKPEVLHAESNAIAKLARSTNSGVGASMYITHAPCIECSKLIHQAGINSVYYRDAYRNTDGLQFLEKCGINVEQV